MSTTQSAKPRESIETPLLQALYLAAHSPSHHLSRAYHNVQSTIALTQAIFCSSIFPITKNYVVDAQPTTIHKSLRTCDMMVSTLETSCELEAQVLVFADRKRMNYWDENEGEPRTHWLEKHPRRFCTRYLYKQKMSLVYAITMTGTYVHLWKCTWNGDMYPVSSPPPTMEDKRGMGAWSRYMDVGDGKILPIMSWCFGCLRKPLGDVVFMASARKVDGLRIYMERMDEEEKGTSNQQEEAECDEDEWEDDDTSLNLQAEKGFDLGEKRGEQADKVYQMEQDKSKDSHEQKNHLSKRYEMGENSNVIARDQMGKKRRKENEKTKGIETSKTQKTSITHRK